MKSERGIFVGYVQGIKGYRMWIPGTNNVKVSRDVLFKSFPDSIGVGVERNTEFFDGAIEQNRNCAVFDFIGDAGGDAGSDAGGDAGSDVGGNAGGDDGSFHSAEEQEVTNVCNVSLKDRLRNSAKVSASSA